MLFPRRIDDDILPRALEGLRRLARSQDAADDTQSDG
jgi:hypothetical protein